MHRAIDKKLVRFGGSQRAPPVKEKLQQKASGHVLSPLVQALLTLLSQNFVGYGIIKFNRSETAEGGGVRCKF